MSDQGIRYEVADGVGRITLSRAESLNALNAEAISQLRQVSCEAAVDAAVRAVLVTGEGRAFCAGGDVKQMMTGWLSEQISSPTMGALQGAGELHQAISALYRMPKPVICAVNGAAAGAGVPLALTGDVVWAAQSASFKLAYTAIGLAPDGGSTFFLVRAVGVKLASELLLTNRKLGAQEALGAGIVSRVLPDDALLPEAEKLAQTLAQGPTRAFVEVKALVQSSLRNGLETQLEDERQAIARAASTADFMEGVEAFVGKRLPKFEGR